ncbi:MAG: hypothetical protein ACREQQ_09345 [Candidatus Binatia bacterium]
MPRLFRIVLFAFALDLSATPAALAQDPYHAGVQRCLANWKTHPFGGSTEYRVIAPRVGVFGIGGDVRDDTATEKPELVYVRPNVSVMSKSVLELLNPNGWYCLERSVAVMAKIEIRLACSAHLATTEEGVSVMGGGGGGVNVMGATRVERVGCDSPRQ